MNQKIHIHLDLSFTTRGIVFCLAALMLLTVTDELGSESVTLTTYYPAPSGVYTQMITTNATYLATSNGNVGIGTTNPTGKLTVTGDGGGTATMGGGFCGSNYTGLSVAGQTGGCGVYNLLSSPTDQSLYINRPNGRAMYFRENNSDQMAIASGGYVGIGTVAPATKLQVQGGHQTSMIRIFSDEYGQGVGGANTADLNLWASEPGWTWTGAGIGNNMISGYYGRRATNRGASYMRLLDNQIMLNTLDSSGVDRNAMMISNGNVYFNTSYVASALNVGGLGTSRAGTMFINGENTAGCSVSLNTVMPQSSYWAPSGICAAGQYASYSPGLWIEGYTFQGHGSSPESTAFIAAWGINDDSYWCCPK